MEVWRGPYRYANGHASQPAEPPNCASCGHLLRSDQRRKSHHTKLRRSNVASSIESLPEESSMLMRRLVEVVCVTALLPLGKTLLALALLVPALQAQALSPARPEAVGMSLERL